MKKLLYILLFVASALAQPSIVDQIKKKIQEINTSLRDIPEIQPLIDEQKRAYKKMTDIESKAGLDKAWEEYNRAEKNECLAHGKGKETSSLYEKRNAISQYLDTKIAEVEQNDQYQAAITQINALWQQAKEILKKTPQGKLILQQYTELVILEKQLYEENYCEWRTAMFSLKRLLNLKTGVS